MRNIDNDNKYYYSIILIGLILSVLWVVFVNTQPYSDFKYYHELASQIAQGGSIGNTYTSVGYAVILGGIYKIFGASIIAAKVFNILLYFIDLVILKKILCRCKLNSVTAKVIFTVFAFFPSNIFYNSMLATEVIFTTFLLVIINLYLSDNKYKFIFIGILTGIETMIKPFFLIFFFAVFLIELIYKHDLKKALLNCAVTLLLTCVVIAPMVIRNTKYNKEFTFVSNNGGIVLYINNNSQNDLGRWMPAGDIENSIVKTDEYKNASMTKRNKMLSNAAKDWIKNHPKEFIKLGFKRLKNTYIVSDDITYSFNESGLSRNTMNRLSKTYEIIKNIVFELGILSILIYSIIIIKNRFRIKFTKENILIIFCIITFYMFTCTYFITEGQTRYSFPLVFVFCFMAGELVKMIIGFKDRGVKIC